MRSSMMFGLVLIFGWVLPAQESAVVDGLAQDAATLRKWLGDYKTGAIRLASKGQVMEAALNRARKVMFDVVRHEKLTAAQLLFKVATVKPTLPGGSATSSDQVAFFGELRVFQIRTMARKFIAGMENTAVEDWLLGLAQKKQGSANYKDVASQAGAALRILAARASPRAKEALLRGCRSFKPEVRVQAINAISSAASLPLVPHFMELIRDKEPYVRIACVNGLGRGLREHTDETIHDTIEPDVAKLRDQAIKVLGGILIRDKIWQVRAAARENLAVMKTKHAIPALIDGLKAELGRTKDPWSLDIRLHKALEGLTGIKMPLGQVRTWQTFWKREAATFKFAPKGAKAGDEGAKDSKYDKFFNLELDSNRVLFIVDFSGSMVETITLKTKGVGTGAVGNSRTTTKSRLVVEELKKIVMTLKDGDLFNIIVFGDDVRPWRAGKNGRPALVKMNDGHRDDLLGGYLDNLQPSGLTNLYGALEAALSIGGRGLHDKYYGLGYDTLYVLSDGAPTTGKITDTEEILRVVQETNSLKRLSINTITFGDLNQLIFLKKLAAQNNGRHIHID
ncbi:MAG: hypothetical protein VX951_09120 [Planctomycetota bacterium]|nr:hypothetical protein [Planctomycetota bacterium]